MTVVPFMRILEAQERAKLPNKWENIPTDTDHESMTIEFACECDAETYRQWNGLKQKTDFHFIIGIAGDGS